MEKQINNADKYITRDEHKTYVSEVDKKFSNINRSIENNYSQTKELTDNISKLSSNVITLSSKLDLVVEKIEVRLDSTDDKIDRVDENLADRVSTNREETEYKLKAMSRETDLKIDRIASNINKQVELSLQPLVNLEAKVDSINEKKEMTFKEKVALWSVLITAIGGIVTATITLIPSLIQH